ncbi:hypothetical protein K492DRAFT_146110 [Lichtheimia hyalospora FSU 10163]|nr:hypothetical protein K492DRAFT_146110 [Lichtheimia hyalospora FSU 10163]
MSNKRSNTARSDQRKKRAKSFFCAKERVKAYDKFAIRPNMKGVMVTCTRGKEAAASKEVIDMFEQYAAEMYPEAFNENNQDEDDEDEDDIEAAIQKEVAQLKKGKKRKFIKTSTNMDCVLFIETRDPIEPVPFVHHILSDLAKTQRKRTRYVSRLLPVQTTCNANLPAIEQTSKPILAPKFHNDNEESSKAFAVVARVRNCDKMDRMSVIQTLASVVGPGHRVDLDNPEITIIAEICQDICMLSAVEDFNEFKKYNIESIISAAKNIEKEEKQQQKQKDD